MTFNSHLPTAPHEISNKKTKKKKVDLQRLSSFFAVSCNVVNCCSVRLVGFWVVGGWIRLSVGRLVGWLVGGLAG